MPVSYQKEKDRHTHGFDHDIFIGIDTALIMPNLEIALLLYNFCVWLVLVNLMSIASQIPPTIIRY